MVFLSDNKANLHQLLFDIRYYLDTKLKLSIKENYQVFPVDKRGIDFVGYVNFHTHTKLRKSIKKNFARMIARRRIISPLLLIMDGQNMPTAKIYLKPY